MKYQALGRKPAAVMARIKKLRESGRIPPAPGQHKWTEEDKKTLFRLKDEGKSYEEIAEVCSPVSLTVYMLIPMTGYGENSVPD